MAGSCSRTPDSKQNPWAWRAGDSGGLQTTTDLYDADKPDSLIIGLAPGSFPLRTTDPPESPALRQEATDAVDPARCPSLASDPDQGPQQRPGVGVPPLVPAVPS